MAVFGVLLVDVNNIWFYILSDYCFILTIGFGVQNGLDFAAVTMHKGRMILFLI